MGYGTQGAKLTYDGPGRLRARVHPINPGATVRVRPQAPDLHLFS